MNKCLRVTAGCVAPHAMWGVTTRSSRALNRRLMGTLRAAQQRVEAVPLSRGCLLSEEACCQQQLA